MEDPRTRGSEDALLSESDILNELIVTIREQERKTVRGWLWILLPINLVALLGIIVWHLRDSQSSCLGIALEEELPTFMSAIDRTLRTQTFNGNLDSILSSYSRQPEELNNTVDKAWSDLHLHFGQVIIPDEDALYFGLDSRHTRFDTSTGIVPYNGYPVEVQASHMLHCVNMLRKGLWFNFEYYKRTEPEWTNQTISAAVKDHFAHCIDQLRQIIMCEVDLGIVPWVWVDGTRSRAVPDFARQKQCKNFESYMKWMGNWHWNNPQYVSLEPGEWTLHYDWAGRQH